MSLKEIILGGYILSKKYTIDDMNEARKILIDHIYEIDISTHRELFRVCLLCRKDNSVLLSLLDFFKRETVDLKKIAPHLQVQLEELEDETIQNCQTILYDLMFIKDNTQFFLEKAFRKGVDPLEYSSSILYFATENCMPKIVEYLLGSGMNLSGLWKEDVHGRWNACIKGLYIDTSENINEIRKRALKIKYLASILKEYNFDVFEKQSKVGYETNGELKSLSTLDMYQKTVDELRKKDIYLPSFEDLTFERAPDDY